MNVIDDFSSYVWSLPLRSKSEAAPVLQSWHRAVENQSGHRLKILVTDNGELVSKSAQNWCADHGIEHHQKIIQKLTLRFIAIYLSLFAS
jgi:Integrase core domain